MYKKTDETLWVIELWTPAMISPIRVNVDAPIVMGRSVVGSDKQPDIDLGPYGASEYGVSRQHLGLYVEDDALMVMDLNSGNGTQLDSIQMEPDQAYKLGKEATLYLAHMLLEIRVVVSPAVEPPKPKQSQPVYGKGELIMIVEDDPEVAGAFSAMMERVGYRTKVCHEVLNAIRAYNRQRPDAIILDLRLPDMNGLELCRYVRRDVVKNTIPVIIVSATRTVEDSAEAMKAGADLFLTKPINPQDMREAVDQLLNRHTESGKNAMLATRHLVGTAPLQAIPAESRSRSIVFFVIGRNDEPLTITVKDTVSLGRTGASSGGAQAHIDLGQFDAGNYGVSRVHALLHNVDGKFYLEDAESTNGTYINNHLIEAGKPMQIVNGDELCLGHLRMFAYFIDETMKSQSAVYNH